MKHTQNIQRAKPTYDNTNIKHMRVHACKYIYIDTHTHTHIQTNTQKHKNIYTQISICI